MVAASDQFSDAERPGVTLTRGARATEIFLQGSWTTGHLDARATDALARAAESAGADLPVALSLDRVTALDTAGALMIARALGALEARGLGAEVSGATPGRLRLLDEVIRHTRPPLAPPPRVGALLAMLLRTGNATIWMLGEARDLIGFLGLTVIVLAKTLAQPWRLRGVALVSHMEQAGLNALPIVGLMSFLIGVVLAYQSADQLAKFGAQIFTVNLVGIGVLRELGIILTAIIVAGRSGSAFTAQIGTMKVNEEIDALQTIGLDPVELLVLPRLIALVLVMPLLTFYADMMGVLGGAVMANFVLDISFFQFARQLNQAVPLWSFWVGIIKAPLFAFIIALVGCYEGLKVERNAESVGRQTTRAVVESIFLVIVLDALLSILFSVLKI